jgi:hypothetical protein
LTASCEENIFDVVYASKLAKNSENRGEVCPKLEGNGTKERPNLVALLALAVRQCIHEIGRENKLDTLALDTKLGLPVAEEVTEVDVEELPR